MTKIPEERDKSKQKFDFRVSRIKVNCRLVYFIPVPSLPNTEVPNPEDAFFVGRICPLSEYKDISMRTELSARGNTDRESDKGDSYAHGLVRMCGGVRIRLL